MDLDEEWLNFSEDTLITDTKANSDKIKTNVAKCNDIHISTKTKISYLNTSIDLYKIFWKIPIQDYHLPKEGIIKKTMKFNSTSEDEVNTLENNIQREKDSNRQILVDILSQSKKKIKDVRKIIIGLSSKDIINQKKRKKSAFYNCFAIIFRVKMPSEDEFSELHIKIFNTGKLEIPGIQDDNKLYYTLDKLVIILSKILDKNITYLKDKTYNVLINSNFKCNFYINRDNLFNIMKYKYNIHSLYDPCSYPGIQCKFYYNSKKEVNNGVCECEKKCGYLEKSVKKATKNKCVEISFMIFRTGSILVVGHCDENILNVVYEYLKKILLEEYPNICNNDTIHDIFTEKKKKPAVKKKKIILFTKQPIYESII